MVLLTLVMNGGLASKSSKISAVFPQAASLCVGAIAASKKD